MRRSDIQLLALVRQGDSLARIEVGSRYLCGRGGFPKSVRTGLDYLTHPSVRDRPEAISAISSNLALDEVLEHGLATTLRRAAEGQCRSAQFKLGIWYLTRHAREAEATFWLESAAAAGDVAAALAVAVAREPGNGVLSVLRTLTTSEAINGAAIATIGAREALQEADLERLCLCLSCAFQLPNAPTEALAELTVGAIEMASALGRPLTRLGVDALQFSLEAMVEAGNMTATYFLGCALAGISCGTGDTPLVRGTNLRAGVALLLRAADGGEARAWFDLYRLVADHESPVANAQMSQFFLEKAAGSGNAVAQRILGGLLFSKTASLKDAERAIHWLSQAAGCGDVLARQLLQTLVLPVNGTMQAAQAMADAIRAYDPLLASRLMLARHFGLTKLEAMVVNPEAGLRPWGLVVDRNPFIVQGRLSAPRAVPAVTAAALSCAMDAAALFARSQRDALGTDGNLRQRAGRLRAACDRFGLDEAMFFASASSSLLDRHRLGPKWAYRAREILQSALASELLPTTRRGISKPGLVSMREEVLSTA